MIGPDHNPRLPLPAGGLSMLRTFLSLAAVACLSVPATGAEPAKPLKVGIIGLDTSHVGAFTSVLNRPNNKGDLAGIRVVAAYPGGSPDLPSSRDRVAG